MKYLISIVAAVILAATPTAAGADLPPYQWVSCAAGTTHVVQINSTVVGLDLGSNAWYIEVSGSIKPCRPTTNGEVFAMASYANGTAVGDTIKFVPDTSETSFKVSRETRKANPTAFCVIASNDQRLACYAVEYVTEEGLGPHPSHPTPIGTDAPAVAIPATVDMTNRDIGNWPNCPSCW